MYFLNGAEMLFVFFTLLTFALMMHTQKWVELLVPEHESEQRHRAVLVVTVFFLPRAEKA